MDPIGMVIAVVIGTLFVSGFARPAPQEPQIIYVIERKEPKREEASGGAGLFIFLLVICLAIYFS